MEHQSMTLGKYEILSELGRGGFGVVYRAVDTRLNRRPVALKVLAPHLLFDPQAVARFHQEAGLAANLHHPNIVVIYDIGEEQGQYYLAMELIDGKSLAEIVKEAGPLPPERVSHILRQLADALDYAHAQGVLHRDIKPSNVLIGKDDHVTLTDFGLARAAETSGLTTSGQTLGTPTYMAPEQLDPITPKPADARTDMYALGIVVYEMLAGRPPFIGQTPAVVTAHLQTPPPPPTQFNASVPEGVSQVVLKALEKDPDARYQTAGALSRALDAVLADITRKARAEAEQQAQLERAERERRARAEAEERKRWLGATMVKVTGAIAAVAVFLFCLWAAATVLQTVFAPAPTAVAKATLTPTVAPTTTPAPPTRAPTAAPPSATPMIVVVTATPAPPTATPRPPTVPPSPTGLGTRITDARGVPMVLVPAGAFTMGSDPDVALAECKKLYIGGTCDRSWFDDEYPPHTVTLSAFYIDQYEVTNARYAECVKAGVCKPPSQSKSDTRSAYYGNSQYDNYPVIFVNWEQAKTYCEWRGGNTRLPTKAEWEKAARGTDARLYPWGDTFDKNLVNSREGGIRDTTAVGSYPSGASPYGALDMAGNVWEWTADWYQMYPGGKPSSDFGEKYRVVRGGAWDSDGNHVRAANRSRLAPSDSHIVVGFRCARSP